MRGRLAGEEADQAGGAVRVRRGLRGGLGEPAGDAAPDHGDGGGEDGQRRSGTGLSTNVASEIRMGNWVCLLKKQRRECMDSRSVGWGRK